ncbi:MAG: hypothetical protein K2N25_04950, partial [Muribaculaceae bacterium]|nr:hypothetical protein [Muribaculaceae bacterium]
YVVFLENFYVNGGGNHGDKNAFQQGKGGKQRMAHNKGMKGQRKGGDRKGNRNVTGNSAQS